jgi:hypothetical protein
MSIDTIGPFDKSVEGHHYGLVYVLRDIHKMKVYVSRDIHKMKMMKGRPRMAQTSSLYLA